MPFSSNSTNQNENRLFKQTKTSRGVTFEKDMTQEIRLFVEKLFFKMPSSVQLQCPAFSFSVEHGMLTDILLLFTQGQERVPIRLLLEYCIDTGALPSFFKLDNSAD